MKHLVIFCTRMNILYNTVFCALICSFNHVWGNPCQGKNCSLIMPLFSQLRCIFLTVEYVLILPTASPFLFLVLLLQIILEWAYHFSIYLSIDRVCFIGSGVCFNSYTNSLEKLEWDASLPATILLSSTRPPKATLMPICLCMHSWCKVKSHCAFIWWQMNSRFISEARWLLVSC